MNIIYDINDFSWSRDDNSFYADAAFLSPIYGDYHCAFPNGKKQFYIENSGTGHFRRFTFVSEFERINMGDGDFEPHSLWEFISEDGIFCRIGITI